MSDLDLTEDDVREEHLREVNQAAQWTYLVTVLGGGTLLMLLLITLLGAAPS